MLAKELWQLGRQIVDNRGRILSKHPLSRLIASFSCGGKRAMVVLLVMAIPGCEAILVGNSSDKSHVVLVEATSQSGASVITTRDEIKSLATFFTPENLRETVFSGDTQSRILGGNVVEQLGFLNLNRVNVGPDGVRQGRGEYYTEVAGEEVLIEPLPRQEISGGQWQVPLTDRPGNVALNFDNVPLSEVVRSVLGGILGVNYVVGETVQGNLTFRSERKLSQTELLQVLADVMARNGYLIQYFNGVYHVGTAEELNTLTGLRERSNLAGDATYVIAMSRTPPEGLEQILAALVPSGNTVSQIPETNNLLVRGDPSQFKSVENLVRSLVESRQGIQALAIIPVRRSPPEAIAEQILQIYEERGLGEVTILPVPTAPGILVVANNNKSISQISKLVNQLDVENRDSAQVRIIQLVNVDALEMAAKLTEIVSGVPLVPSNGNGVTGGGSNVIAAAIESANRGTSARGVSTSPGSGIGAPRFIRGSNSSEASTQSGGVEQETVPGAGQEITFSADSRNNALLVRSNFLEFQRIQEVVRALDVALAQVVIEATVVEVDINDSLQYGVQMFLQSNGFEFRSANAPGASGDPGGSGFVAQLADTLGKTSVQGVITALQAVTNVQVISSPYLTVVDGATSRLNVGDQIPFVIAAQSSQSGGDVTVTQEIESRDIGVILDVTPRISPNNTVLLDIVQEVSSTRVAETVAGQNPIISQRRVQSQIIVQSGTTALLGGLIQERSDNGENGIPLLRRIPGLGDLFNRRSNSNSRTELLIMITPRVVRNSDGLDDLTRRLRMQTIRR